MGIKNRLTQSGKEKVYNSNILSLLQAYEDTGLTPHEIEQMKAGKVIPMQPVRRNIRESQEPEERYVLPKWFQEAVKKRRQNVRISLEKLAELSGASYAIIRWIEMKENYAARKDIVQAVCTHLGLSWALDKLEKEVEENDA